MNWYKIAQQTEFPEITKEIPTEEDIMYDFFEDSDEAIYNILRELKDSKSGDKQPWPLVPFARVNKIWQDYAIYGIVRDERGMNEIADRMIKNIHRLYANTYLMGHTQLDPKKHFEEHKIDEKTEERYYWEYANSDNGQARISDYAIDDLRNDAIELKKTRKAEEKLLIVDRMFNRIHQRSDLPGMFIEGGTESLNQLFSRPTQAFNLKRYKIAQLNKSPETIEIEQCLQQLVENLKAQYNGTDLEAWYGNGYIEIAKIEVPLEIRNQGIGHKIIRSIKDFAQEKGKIVVLRPEPQYGKKKKLDRFYRDLGFVHNKGRNTNYQLSSPFAPTMYWKPIN